MSLNRRGFLKALISAAGAVAVAPYVPSIIREPVRQWGEEKQAMLDALVASMIQTKEVMAANVLNNAFGDPDAKDLQTLSKSLP